MLLQEIRTIQASSELGVRLDYEICHKTPYVKILGEKKPLVFPKFMFDYNEVKDIEMLFIGLKTPSRVEFLKQFPKATIIYSDNGRDLKKKIKDDWYFNQMARAKFVLCPDGDFTWTYRFFEAAIFRAIPIVENVADVYTGYRFYKANDVFLYDKQIVESNRNKVYKETTL